MTFKADWLLFSFLALFLWGIWGFFAKIATHYMSPSSVYLYGLTGALLVGIFTVSFLGFRFEAHPIGIIYSISAGILSGLAIISFYFAMQGGRASVVVAMTALYPLVTLLLSSIILKEHITLKQIIGIFFAIIAMVLLAG
jgi:transporter family protein